MINERHPMDHPQEWRRRAKCHGADTELFYPPRDKRLYKKIADQSKAICNGKDSRAVCPVRVDCLLYALRRGEEHGIWGGMSHRERNALLRKWRKRYPDLDLEFTDDELRPQAQALIDERGK